MSISFPIEDWIFGCFFVNVFFFFLLRTLRIQEGQREREKGRERERAHKRAHPKACVRAKQKVLYETLSDSYQ